MKKALLYSLFFLCGLSLYAQTHVIDSLRQVLKTEKEDTNKVKTLNTLSYKLEITGNHQLSDSLFKKALHLAQKIGYKKGEEGAYITKGLVCYDQDSNTAALNYFNLVLKIAAAQGDENTMARAYRDIGTVYNIEDDYPEALKNYLQALKLCQKTGNKTESAVIYQSMGEVYLHIHSYAQALSYGKKALKLHKILKTKQQLAYDYADIGSTYSSEKNYTESLKNYLQALQLSKELNNTRLMTGIYLNVGNIYYTMGCYIKAFQYYVQGLALAHQIHNKYYIGYAYGSMATAYLKQKKYKQARLYLDSTFVMSKKTGHKESMQDLYNSYAILDSATGNYRAAFADYKKFILYGDSITNDKEIKKVTEEQMQYKFDTKQAAEQAAQDKKDAIAAADKKRQRVVTASVSIGLLLVLIFAGILLNRFKLTQRQKKIIEEQKATVEEKNKNIIDSITYAKRLQDAILPHESELKKLLPQSFVIYKPKDIVAGDFYWLEKTGDTILVAAADCTGHGVPGAMVSVVCSNALNQAVKEFNLTEPGKVLDKTRELVLATFAKSAGEIKDGMDISLCAITPLIAGEGVGVRLQWAGAYNPLWYAQGNEIKEVDADKQPIGETDNAKPFTTHTINLNKGDTLYLFTDGYADQFGGEKGKKFKYKQMQQTLLSVTGQSMEAQKQAIEQAFESWKGTQEQTDDVCVVGIRV